jgi:sugar phosphate isomerase/epimerase
MEWTIGCTTRPYSSLSFDEACQHIAAAGYNNVALFGNAGVTSESSRETVLVARRAAEEAGLAPSMLLARAQLERGLDEAATDYRRLIDNAALLGAAWLLDLGTGHINLRQDYVALMRHVAPHAAQAGIGISLKPHGGITLTTADLLAIHHEVDHPAFGICYDPGNLIYYPKGAELPEMHVVEVAPLVTTCIIKDCALDDGQPDVMITPGEGLVDFPAVLSALVEGEFRGPLYLECVGGDTLGEIDDNVQRTLAFVHHTLVRNALP